MLERASFQDFPTSAKITDRELTFAVSRNANGEPTSNCLRKTTHVRCGIQDNPLTNAAKKSPRVSEFSRAQRSAGFV
jgi:hypothetical protein